MTDIYILSARRSAIGIFGGALKNITAADLTTAVMQAAIRDAGLPPQSIQLVTLGNVVHTSAKDPYLARLCSVNAGVSQQATAYAINRLCGSSLQAIVNVVMAIKLGDISVGLAAGVESMSRAPHIFPTRSQQKMGDMQTQDMLLAPLTDPFGHGHMGVTAENVASKFGVSRADMDAFSVESHRRAVAAQTAGYFEKQIVPIQLKTKRQTTAFVTDEHVRADISLETLAKLRPVFKPDGLVTAGNSSGINDGAAALVIASAKSIENNDQAKPLARILAYGHSGVDPAIMGIGPILASKQALERAQLSVNDLGVIESNEAFAAQACAVNKILGFDPEKVNPNGGAVALGHPIGATGAIITTKLVHELQRTQERYGLATMCIGGGQGIALVVERV